MKQSIVLKKAGEEWNNLCDKKKWEEMAAEDQRRYRRELETRKGVFA